MFFFESGLPWGVEWWKYWFCSFFWDMEMVCTWSHKSRLSRILHFLQRCCLFPKTLYFLLSILEKKTCLYTMFLMPAMNSVLLLYILLYHMYTHIYIYTYLHTHTHFDKFIIFFTKNYVSRKYVFDIEHTWVQFPAANSAFSETCSASFHAVHECFSKKTCQDWTCTSSKDGLTTIESGPFPGIIYILP